MKVFLHLAFAACCALVALFGGAAASCTTAGGSPDEAAGPYDDAEVGLVSAELTSAPSAVRCVQITVVNVGTINQKFSVTSGANTSSLDLGKLAAGATTFTAAGYNVDCASVSASTVPDWVGSPVMATVRPGINPAVALTLSPSTSTTASIDFKQAVSKVFTGSTLTYALMPNGAVSAWGNNGSYGLGNGTLTPATSSTPVNATTLSNIASLSSAQLGSHSCAINNSGALLCWGDNTLGKLGDGTNTTRPSPVSVATGIISVATSQTFTCALRASDGRAVCAGDNSSGQLCDGTLVNHMPLQPAMSGTGHRQIVAGTYGACVRTSLGTVSCWGSNAFGQLGNGTSGGEATTPVAVQNLSAVTEIAAGPSHFCALKANGTVWCWGSNQFATLGDGTTSSRNAPVQVQGITNAVQIAAGWEGSCARLADETVKCWGKAARVGDGAGVDRLAPVTVRDLTGATWLTMGAYHACAKVASGDLRCWGDNSYGQLGDGTYDARYVATSVRW